jgi:hypothetical protein
MSIWVLTLKGSHVLEKNDKKPHDPGGVALVHDRKYGSTPLWVGQ